MGELHYVLTMEGINKSFFGVKVLDNVEFCLNHGEIHGLVGENGAGKSTLMKILNGIYIADSGKITLNGEEFHPTCPLDALKKGISIIHQELSLAPDMTIRDNIYLGTELKKKPFNFLNKKVMSSRVEALLKELGINAHAETLVGDLDIANQQMVEIARALFYGSSVIVMDEPTSSLADKEVDVLFEKMRELKKKGTSIVFISHRMYELPAITDRITVLRDGCIVGTKPTCALSEDEIVSMMVGRSIENAFGKSGNSQMSREVVLEAKYLTSDYITNVSFSLHKGEVLGFAGLVGAGRTELARVLFGIDKKRSGEILIDDSVVQFKTPKEAISHGMGFIPEDRKKHGLVVIHTVAQNLTLIVTKLFMKLFRVNRKKEQEIIDKYANSLSIKMTGPEQFIYNLSGGNQQKVVVSKWLAANPKILIMDEPTRGIDVGAKAEIYHLVRRLSSEGISIIVISSELPEVINLSDRIAVMHEGELVKIIDNPKELDDPQKTIMHFATGGK